MKSPKLSQRFEFWWFVTMLRIVHTHVKQVTKQKTGEKCQSVLPSDQPKQSLKRARLKSTQESVASPIALHLLDIGGGSCALQIATEVTISFLFHNDRLPRWTQYSVKVQVSAPKKKSGMTVHAAKVVKAR